MNEGAEARGAEKEFSRLGKVRNGAWARESKLKE